jgi:hypothetical protein
MTDTPNNDHPPESRIPDAEWAQRRLCPDGHCIGVIGLDGRCKACGRPAGEDLSGSAETAPAPDFTDDAIVDAGPTEAAPSPPQANARADDWDNRRLCPDGNCIGVIGPDGRCKECGRPAEDR